jgi:hypothetical protein
MARDHFVAQTCLKHFAGNDGKLRAYRKSDGLSFPCHPRDICHEWDGDLVRDFRRDEALLGGYRKIFEPAWDRAIVDLVDGVEDPSVKLAVAGYWANLMVCTPAWTRVGAKIQEYDTMRTVRAHDVLTTRVGKPDPKLKAMLAAFDAGHYRIEAERDAIRAMNAAHLSHHAWQLYNADWIVLQSDSEVDFITSDNPVAFDDPGPWRGGEGGLPRYLPVTSRLCIYGLMDPRAPRDEPDFTRSPRGVERVNRAVAQCAEELVCDPAWKIDPC